MCVCLVFTISLPSRTAALSNTLNMTKILSPTTVGHTGATLSPTQNRPTKRKDIKRTKERDKRKVHSRAGLASPPRCPALGPHLRPCLHPFWPWPPADARLPTLVLSKNSTTAPTASSFHSHLSAGALGCSHPQSFPTLFQSSLIWGAHSVKRWWRDCLLPQLHHQESLVSSLWGPVTRSWRKAPVAA